MDRTITIRIKGTWLRYLAVILVTVLIAAPTAVWASHGFNDVPDSNTFHADIDWLADNGVTLGCNPPANDEFCPTDKVSREQMAAFMKRLASNQVVDAATAVTAETADDSDLLEGFTVAELSPRAAFDSSNTLANVSGTALTTTITAPVDGILIINASVNLFRFDATTDLVACFVDIDEAGVLGSSMRVVVGGTFTDDICSTGGAAVVTAGFHNIDFEVLSVSADTFLGSAYLTVLLVPCDAIGQTPPP